MVSPVAMVRETCPPMAFAFQIAVATEGASLPSFYAEGSASNLLRGHLNQFAKWITGHMPWDWCLWFDACFLNSTQSWTNPFDLETVCQPECLQHAFISPRKSLSKEWCDTKWYQISTGTQFTTLNSVASINAFCVSASLHTQSWTNASKSRVLHTNCAIVNRKSKKHMNQLGCKRKPIRGNWVEIWLHMSWSNISPVTQSPEPCKAGEQSEWTSRGSRGQAALQFTSTAKKSTDFLVSGWAHCSKRTLKAMANIIPFQLGKKIINYTQCYWKDQADFVSDLSWELKRQIPCTKEESTKQISIRFWRQTLCVATNLCCSHHDIMKVQMNNESEHHLLWTELQYQIRCGIMWQFGCPLERNSIWASGLNPGSTHLKSPCLLDLACWYFTSMPFHIHIRSRHHILWFDYDLSSYALEFLESAGVHIHELRLPPSECDKWVAPKIGYPMGIPKYYKIRISYKMFLANLPFIGGD